MSCWFAMSPTPFTRSPFSVREMRLPTLSARERQVLELVSEGMRNKEIAAALGISADTAGMHVKNIYTKLNVHDRTAAVAKAIRRGIIRIQ